MATKWQAELPKIKKLLLSGTTLEEVGKIYGVSKARIQQLVSKYLKLDRADYGCSLRVKKERSKKLKKLQRTYNRDVWRGTDLEMAQSAYFTRKRQNVKQQGKWDFDLCMSDIPNWPTHCPILGMELDWFADYRQENSPSLDRIDSKQGYIPGNVQLISWRANRLKNNGTAEEHRRIAEYLDSLSEGSEGS